MSKEESVRGNPKIPQGFFEIGTPIIERSREPLGDPSARVFEVFLIVLDGVQGETLWGGNPARATTLISESERQGNRQSSRQLSSNNA